MTNFKSLGIGEHFLFPELRSFSAVCKKVSTRCYTWYDSRGHLVRSRVGSVYVVVERMTVELTVI